MLCHVINPDYLSLDNRLHYPLNAEPWNSRQTLYYCHFFRKIWSIRFLASEKGHCFLRWGKRRKARGGLSNSKIIQEKKNILWEKLTTHSLHIELGWRGILLWLKTKELPQVLKQERMIIPWNLRIILPKKLSISITLSPAKLFLTTRCNCGNKIQEPTINMIQCQ